MIIFFRTLLMRHDDNFDPPTWVEWHFSSSTYPNHKWNPSAAINLSFVEPIIGKCCTKPIRIGATRLHSIYIFFFGKAKSTGTLLRNAIRFQLNGKPFSHRRIANTYAFRHQKPIQWMLLALSFLQTWINLCQSCEKDFASLPPANNRRNDDDGGNLS